MNFKIVRFVFIVISALLAIFVFKKNIPLAYFFIPLVLYNLLLVLGAIFIQWNFYIKSINSVSTFKHFMDLDESKKNICLTFDDGIHTKNTPLTLDILKRYQINAHFFIIGKNIQGNENILKRMHDEGHSIGNHSFGHTWKFDLQSTKSMQLDIEATNQLIKETIGEAPVLFRPPYGVTNPNLARAIKNTNMLSMGWNLRSFDTVAKSADQLLKKLIDNTKPNSLILLHERCDLTVEVLTEYIEYCLLEGYTFVTLKTNHEV